MAKSDVVDIEGRIFAETDRAIMYSITGLSTDAEWLPRSQIEIDNRGPDGTTVTMPEWLAIEKGFV